MATLHPAQLSTSTASINAGLTISESFDGRRLTTLRLRGYIDVDTTNALRQTLRRHTAPGTIVMLDLTGVRAIDEFGVAAVLSFATDLNASGGQVSLIAPDTILQALAAVPGLSPHAVSITLH